MEARFLAEKALETSLDTIRLETCPGCHEDAADDDFWVPLRDAMRMLMMMMMMSLSILLMISTLGGPRMIHP